MPLSSMYLYLSNSLDTLQSSPILRKYLASPNNPPYVPQTTPKTQPFLKHQGQYPRNHSKLELAVITKNLHHA